MTTGRINQVIHETAPTVKSIYVLLTIFRVWVFEKAEALEHFSRYQHTITYGRVTLHTPAEDGLMFRCVRFLGPHKVQTKEEN